MYIQLMPPSLFSGTRSLEGTKFHLTHFIVPDNRNNFPGSFAAMLAHLHYQLDIVTAPSSFMLVYVIILLDELNVAKILHN